MTRPALSLPWFVGLSLAGHAMLLAGWYAPQWGGDYQPPPLAVSVSAPHGSTEIPAPPRETPAPTPRVARSAPQTARAPDALPTRTASSTTEAPATPETTPDRVTPASASTQPRHLAQARVFVNQRLNHDIARYFTYPALARRKGWQGTVLLGFEVSADGRIHHIRVKRSSGHGLLDHSALRALEQVERIEGFADRFAFRLYNVDLPVIYRLGTRG